MIDVRSWARLVRRIGYCAASDQGAPASKVAALLMNISPIEILESSRGQSFDRFAGDYDRYASLETPVHLKWVMASLPDHGRRALDVGCGSGRFTVLLAQHFDHVIGLDISEPLIEIARRRRTRPNIDYRVGDLMTFDDDSRFDLIFSSTTLHHLPDLTPTLRHLHRLLSAGGTMMLIDNVAPRPHVPRWRHIAGAVRRFPFAVARLGLRDATWVLKFETGRVWLDHLDSDRYLTPREFEEVSSEALPGGRFVDFGYLHALIWRNTL